MEGQTQNTPREPLRTASIYCLATWAAVWLLFLLIRLSPLDIRVVPGAPAVMLVALAVAFLAPIVATVLTAAVLIRPPRALLSWLSLGCALAALVLQTAIFFSSRWL